MPRIQILCVHKIRLNKLDFQIFFLSQGCSVSLCFALKNQHSYGTILRVLVPFWFLTNEIASLMPDPLKGKASLAGLVGKSNANAAELPTRSLGTVTNSARYLNISSSVRQLSYCFTKVGGTAAIQLNYWEKFNSELPHKKREGHMEKKHWWTKAGSNLYQRRSNQYSGGLDQGWPVLISPLRHEKHVASYLLFILDKQTIPNAQQYT